MLPTEKSNAKKKMFLRSISRKAIEMRSNQWVRIPGFTLKVPSVVPKVTNVFHSISCPALSGRGEVK